MANLDYIQEKDEITSSITELFIATDLRDWPRLEACFTDKVQFDMTSVGGPHAEVTPQDISKGWDEGLKALKAVHHQIGNLRVAVQGKKAKASCYGIAYHYLPNPTGQNTRIFVGDYDMELQKDDTGWKISALTFKCKFIDGNADLEGSR